jgi:hypothetical protein
MICARRLSYRGNLGQNVRERAQSLLERPMVKELDLPAKAGGPARALLKKLGIAAD